MGFWAGGVRLQQTIREILERYIQEQQLSISKFSQLSDINTGTLSRILKGTKPISLKQLQQITYGMALPEDALFEEYIEECFASFVNLRRIRPFIFRCAELERLDCIDEVLGRLLDDRQYNAALFDMAEQLFEEGKLEAATVIYKQVAESERFQHSERLAFCHYRLFMIDLGEDLERNLLAATKFEPYMNRLPEMKQLDALKQVMHIFGMVHKWSKVDVLAEQLQQLASSLYHFEKKSPDFGDSSTQPEQPIYYFILYSYLARATVSEHLGDYKRALYFVSLYGNGEEWVQEKDETAKQITRQFSEWANINSLLYRLMSGEIEVMDEYVSYIAQFEDEIFIALSYIIQAANKFKINIDDILERFWGHVPIKVEDIITGVYKQEILKDAYARFFIDLAIYYFNVNKNVKKAIEFLLVSLDLSVKINSKKNIMDCFTWFEKYREYSSSHDIQKFKTLSSEVHELNAKAGILLFDSV